MRQSNPDGQSIRDEAIMPNSTKDCRVIRPFAPGSHRGRVFSCIASWGVQPETRRRHRESRLRPCYAGQNPIASALKQAGARDGRSWRR
ncbi:hypothetical protein Pden_0886 [Paracoccus denitrificans PD1222]|uniref:Uncharacterized protein n=1 Tax=Paracoccus denitrificans (strain Pd 1222) TaxID=318586 RepID=A1B0F3_PARDP|nr:hypothetical protein Pden_0886 [Paracoccus denitrificans PD1222]